MAAADGPRATRAGNNAWPTEVIVLRAADRAELLLAVDALLAFTKREPSTRLLDLAFTLNTTLAPGGVRLAIVAADVPDLARRLAAAREQLAGSGRERIHDPSGTYFESAPLAARGTLAVLFPGEGAQYLGMLGDLPAHFPEICESLAQTDEFVGPDGDDPRSVSRFFVSPTALTNADREHFQRRLRQVDFAMFSVLAADSAISILLDGLNLEPASVCGHSAGELAALAAAGSIGVATEVEPIVAAMRALGDAEERSGHAEAVLLAAAASREILEKILATIPAAAMSTPKQSAFVAMDNCPHQAVVVGLPEPMEQLEAALKAQRVVCERLPFSRPYHTRLFEPFMGPLREMFDAVTFRRPQRRIYSCTTARPFPDEPEAIRDVALAHWSSPVEFRKLVERMYADGVRIFVEAGPRGVLSAFVQDILRGREFVALPADLPRRSALTQINHLVAQLAVHHVAIDLGYLYHRRGAENVAWREISSGAGRESNGSRDAAAVGAAREPSARNPTDSAAPASEGLHPPASARGPAAVLAGHFDVMDRFLVAQQAMMREYLHVAMRRRPADRSRRAVLPAALPAQPITKPAVTRTPAAPAVHYPLGGSLVSHTPDAELVVRRRLDLTEDRYADHHTVGGRDISRLNPSQHGLPVMPMTFILEMMAEAAARLVPGRVVIAARDIRLQRWLAFDEESVSTVEIAARRVPESSPGDTVEVAIEVNDLGVADHARSSTAGVVASAVIALSRDYPPAPRAAPLLLSNEQTCRVTLAGLYRGLFHGPLFQGVRSLDRFGDEGLVATIEVLPRAGLFRSCDEPRFLCDPVTVDIGMHPAAGWHLEQPDQAGRILLPFELKRVEFFGPAPAVGTRLVTHNRITHAAPRQFNHAGEFIRDDGTLWCRLTDVKCWRFYLPFGDVNFNGPKDEYFISKPWSAGIPRDDQSASEETVCVRLDPSGDMSQSAMQDAAARITLSDREMRTFRQQRLVGQECTAWLFSRIAMKDAARIWWHKQTGVRHFTADLECDEDHCGRPTIRLRDGTRPNPSPTVAVAQLPGLIVALATGRCWAGVGLARVDAGRAQQIWDDMDNDQQRALERLTGDVPQRVARCEAARAALHSALGPALIADLALASVRDVESEPECVHVELDSSLMGVFPDLVGQRFVVRTVLENDVAIASIIGPHEAGKK